MSIEEPSDTDREALIESARGEIQATDLPASVKELLHDMADALEAQPVQVEVTEASVTVLAKHMANVATDWNHNDCGDDDHLLEHSNWEAYTDDARRALAALGGDDA